MSSLIKQTCYGTEVSILMHFKAHTDRNTHTNYLGQGVIPAEKPDYKQHEKAEERVMRQLFI